MKARLSLATTESMTRRKKSRNGQGDVNAESSRGRP